MSTPTQTDGLNVQHNEAEHRFEIQVDAHLAVLEYQIENDNIIFHHTSVPPELEGKGIGSKLAQAGLAYAAEKLYRVVPLCSFVNSYIQRHPEYQKLVRQ